MKVLIVNGDLPMFPGQAGHEYLHTTGLARLAERVGLVSLLHTKEQDERKRALVEAGVSLYLWRSPHIDTPTRKSSRGRPRRLRRLAEACYNLARNWRAYPSDTLVQDLQFRNIAGPLVEALSECSWGALVVVQSNCARWLDYLPRPPLSVLVMHDVRALVYERRAAAAGSLIERLACRREARRYRRFEQTYCRRFDVVMTVSPADEAWVRTHYRPRRLITVPIPVDTAYFAPMPRIRERTERIVFTGMMAHPPNVDAAGFFAREVLPRVQMKRPAAEFWIVGRDVAPSVASLAMLPGVVVTGFVPDMRPYIAQAAVVVVPLRFGSGMRNKILEAWAMEKCVVSTRVGAEGLDCEDGVNIVLADDAQTLADRVVDAMSNPSLRDRIRSRGRALVSSVHDPDALANRYADAIGAALRETARAEAPLRALIDLRWMRPAVAGGIENLSRSFLDHLIRLDRFNRYTVLVPAEVQYDFDARRGANVKFVAGDGPRVAMREVALRTLRLLHRRLGLQYWRTPDVETLRRAAAMDAEVALSIPGYIHPDLMPLTNVLVMPDIQHEYCPEFFPGRALEERRRLYTQSAHRAAHICAISEFTRQTLIERLGIAPDGSRRLASLQIRSSSRGAPRAATTGACWTATACRSVATCSFPAIRGRTRIIRAQSRPCACCGRPTASTRCSCARGVRGAPRTSCAPRSGPRAWTRECDSSATARRAICRRSTRALPRSCFPSLFEGFGIPLLEAMWCDCPIVCSNTTSLPEIAGDAALLVDPRSPEELAHAISRVLTDAAIRQAVDRAWPAASQSVFVGGVHACHRGRPASSPTAPQRVGLPMAMLPRISIVTACLDRTASLAETVESVVRQRYPNLEHLIVTARFEDGMLGRLARHPKVTFVSDPGRGRASALNMGFSLASGAIRAILDAGDCLLPGALDVVAREIDPTRDATSSWVAVRSWMRGGHVVGIEHPSDFEGHRRVLEIWRGHAVPRPALFWAAEVWRSCGPMDESVAPAWLDYDLCCRFSRSYRFHRVDQVLATARLRACAATGADRRRSPRRRHRVSRRYWGAALRPMRWRLALSLRRYSFDRVARARRHVRTAKEKRRSVAGGSTSSMHAAAAILLAPKVALYVGAYPVFRECASRFWRRGLDRVGQSGRAVTDDRGLSGADQAWSDGWVGPRLTVTREIERETRVVGVAGSADLQHMTKPLILTVRLNGREIGRHRVHQPGELPRADSSLGTSSAWGAHGGCRGEYLVRARQHDGIGDLRPLAWRLRRLELDGVTNR